MAIRIYKPTSPGRRNASVNLYSEVTKRSPEKTLLKKLTKTGGRNHHGVITSQHRGGGQPRLHVGNQPRDPSRHQEERPAHGTGQRHEDDVAPRGRLLFEPSCHLCLPNPDGLGLPWPVPSPASGTGEQ